MTNRFALLLVAVLAALPGCGESDYNTLAPERLQHAGLQPARKKAAKKLPPSYAGRMEVQAGVK